MTNSSLLIDQRESDAQPANDAKPNESRIADDAVLLRAAVELTRDIQAPRPIIYWSDFILSVTIGYAALLSSIFITSVEWSVIAGFVAVLALYRAGSFIHELTHMKHASVPGFRLVWNLAVGIPMLVPSFLYEGVHTLHHARTRYGTIDDPEYLPLALMKPHTLLLFMGASILAPVALLVRFALLAPISRFYPKELSTRRHK